MGLISRVSSRTYRNSSITNPRKMSDPIRVLVTGAAGQIAYSLLCKIANGEVFGENQPVTLHMLDIPIAETALNGVKLELQDCAFPLLEEVVATTSVQEAFTDIDVALLVGAMPRRQGMERKDLLAANAKIFKEQGAALDNFAKKSVKVLVVGNPANTNALIAAQCAPSIPKENFTALTRLDHNRACAQLALRLSAKNNATVSAQDVSNVTIWGNHSSTQYPDVSHAVSKAGCCGGKKVTAVLEDEAWLKDEFITTVQKRGAAIIKARKLSSAMSAAKAICDHTRDWWCGTQGDSWVSMGVWSTGNSYNVPDGVIYSFPVKCSNGKWEIVNGLEIDQFSREKMDATANELVDERKEAFSALGI